MSKNMGQNLPFSISQNFLTSRKLIERLLHKTNINKNDIVLEIGAGKGHITKALTQRSKQVIAYEIDKKLYDNLLHQLDPNTRLIYGDFLKSNLLKTPYKVFSNIPFSRTTEIMRKFTIANNPPTDMWLVMEKGAAKRFCGFPFENLNSLLIKPFFETKIVYHFQREDFHPAPKVNIVLLEIKQKQIPDIMLSQRSNYQYFISHSIKNGLFGSQSLLTKNQIKTALKHAKLPQIERSGQVLYVQWLCLFRYWLQFIKKHK